jgi:hypothetical protein
MEPIDAIKAICKLSRSSNQSFGDSSSVKPEWTKNADQNQQLQNARMLFEEII